MIQDRSSFTVIKEKPGVGTATRGDQMGWQDLVEVLFRFQQGANHHLRVRRGEESSCISTCTALEQRIVCLFFFPASHFVLCLGFTVGCRKCVIFRIIMLCFKGTHVFETQLGNSRLAKTLRLKVVPCYQCTILLITSYNPYISTCKLKSNTKR